MVAPPGQFRRERNWTRSARRGRAREGAHQPRRTTEKTNFGLRFRLGETPEGLSGSLAPGMGKEKRRELERSHWLLRALTRYADHEPRQGTKSPGAILNSRRLARRVSHRDVANKPGNGRRPKPTSCVHQVRFANHNRRRAEGGWGERSERCRLAHSTRRRDKIAGSDFEQPEAGPKGEPQGCGE